MLKYIYILVYMLGMRDYKYLTSHHSGSPTNAALLTAQYPLERVPELGAENRVDDRIERRIEIAQPQE